MNPPLDFEIPDGSTIPAPSRIAKQISGFAFLVTQWQNSGTVLDPTLAIRLAIGLYRLTQRRIQLMGSADWPIADGKVTTSKLGRDELQGWATELTYFYVAMGEYYSGTYRCGFRRKKAAEAFLERFPGQTPIPVHYKHEKPEISTLLRSDMSLLLAGL